MNHISKNVFTRIPYFLFKSNSEVKEVTKTQVYAPYFRYLLHEMAKEKINREHCSFS